MEVGASVSIPDEHKPLDGKVEVYNNTDDGTQIYWIDGILVEHNFTSHPFAYHPLRPDARYLKVETKTPPSPPRLWARPEDEEGARRQDVKVAEQALRYYNNKHHTDYELVDPMLSNATNDQDGVWYHANFTARRGAASQEDSSAKHFFAEMKARPKGDVITACRILDGVKTVAGCGMCNSVTHPTSGFRKGHYPNKSRVLRSHKRNGLLSA